MREMSYQMMLTNDGYVISVPDGQTGRMEVELLEGHYWDYSKHKGYQHIEAGIGDFVEPVTFGEDTDPKLKKNYRKIFRTEGWKGWHITEIRIQPGYISIDVDHDARRGECFCITPIEPSSHLKFSIKAPALDGRIETYVVEMETHKCRDRDGKPAFFRNMVVEEPCDIGRKRIVFENGIPSKDGDEGWIKVLVHEWR